MKLTTVKNLPPVLRRKRTAAYARVSSGKDAMLQSLSAQISYYSEYIKRHVEWEFVGVYADEAVTGTKDSRAQFKLMLDDCRSGKIELIVTKSLTRFARNTVTALEVLRELKALGIDVFFEKENLHSISRDGEFMLTILASYAQEESRSVSENCLWRIRRMFEQGRPNTGKMLGYRLVDGKLCIVPSEATIVRQIFADYLAGYGKLAIAKRLNAEGIAPMYGKYWHETVIYGILRNEKYTGDLTLQKTYRENHITKRRMVNKGERPKYHVRNSHEPIVTPEIFEAVQAELARRATNCTTPDPAESNPFKGLVRCGFCGGSYKRKHTAYGTKYDKIVFICRTFNSLGKDVCASQQIPEDILMAKTAEILGLSIFDELAMLQDIAEIKVTGHGRLRFVFKDGREKDADWQNPSRRDSWTEEMKQAAREKAYKQHQEKRKQIEAEVTKSKEDTKK